jgi:putative spermidine/putrescine transport system permease protein
VRRAVSRPAGWRLLAPALLLLLIAFVVPVGLLVPTSLRPYVPLVGITGGVTAQHYVKLLTDSYYLEIIGRTLVLGLTVTCSTLLVGYPVASIRCRIHLAHAADTNKIVNLVGTKRCPGFQRHARNP